MPEFSIVVPVYNEADNIATLLRRIAAEVAGDHETLLLYDFPEDTTLAAVAAMDPPPTRVRLVHNTLGRGPARAIEAGLKESAGRLGAVVTMADLSDPPAVIDAMVAKLADGCDVVGGSRYMPGGRQIGGPWLKGRLSMLAGLIAYRLTGVATRDVTTNFRAYSRRLIEAEPVTSRAGFEVGLEMTVKCHLRGWRVCEVPSSWHDRTAGASRFRLVQWLPSYLKWYLKLLAGDPLGLRSRRRRS